MAAVDAGTAESTEPVGTGPFVFSDYNPDDNFVVTTNPDYWLEAPDGEPYPYLDEIEFVVQSENQTRTSAMISGEIDIMHMDSGDSIAQLRDAVEAGDIQMFELDERQETGLHPDQPTPSTAVSDVRIRRAMAMAINEEVYDESRNAGIFPIANGPFSPGSIGYLEDNGFPSFDPEEARQPGRGVRGRERRGGDPVQDDDRPVQPRDRRAVPAVLGGRRPDGRDRPDRAGGVHRGGPAGQLRGLRLAQPRRLRPRHPGGVVALGQRR